MDDLEKLEKRLIKRLEEAITAAAEDEFDAFWDIQPPSTIVQHAAQAAAAVLMAFERGYRMDDGGRER